MLCSKNCCGAWLEKKGTHTSINSTSFTRYLRIFEYLRTLLNLFGSRDERKQHVSHQVVRAVSIGELWFFQNSQLLGKSWISLIKIQGPFGHDLWNLTEGEIPGKSNFTYIFKKQKSGKILKKKNARKTLEQVVFAKCELGSLGVCVLLKKWVPSSAIEINSGSMQTRRSRSRVYGPFWPVLAALRVRVRVSRQGLGWVFARTSIPQQEASKIPEQPTNLKIRAHRL